MLSFHGVFGVANIRDRGKIATPSISAGDPHSVASWVILLLGEQNLGLNIGFSETPGNAAQSLRAPGESLLTGREDFDPRSACAENNFAPEWRSSSRPTCCQFGRTGASLALSCRLLPNAEENTMVTAALLRGGIACSSCEA